MHLKATPSSRTAPLFRRMLFIAVLLLMQVADACSQAAEAKLDALLGEPVTIAWQGVPLRTALTRLSETRQLVIWLDRRVDPTTPISLSAADRPLGETLQALAEQAGASATPFAGVIYVGPPQVAGELATLAVLAREPLAGAPVAVRNRWLMPRPWKFARLSQPRQLLVELAASVDARVDNQQVVPHDLWPERTLPAMAPIDGAVLLLAGFDQTPLLSPDGSSLTVAAIKRPAVIAREYRVPNSRQAAFDAAVAEMGGAVQSAAGGRRTIAARIEDHSKLRAIASGRPVDAAQERDDKRNATPSTAAIDDRRFTLTIDNKPIAAVLNQLAAQLNLQIEWDGAIADDEVRNALVSCQVAQAELDELLRALLAPAGLDFERSENRILIRRP
jgi:hypothetical protein